MRLARGPSGPHQSNVVVGIVVAGYARSAEVVADVIKNTCYDLGRSGHRRVIGTDPSTSVRIGAHKHVVINVHRAVIDSLAALVQISQFSEL